MPDIDLYLSRGSWPNAPPRQMGKSPVGPGPLYRRLRNWRPHDGFLKRREALTSTSLGTPSVDLNGSGNEQWPLAIHPLFWDRSGSRWVVVTNRELWVIDGSTWNNVTPTYTLGNVASISGGVITGSGTSWSGRVAVGNLIQVPSASSSWFKITAVGGATSITAPGIPNLGAGSYSYTVRRTFGGASVTRNDPVFVAQRLDDVYVCGLLAYTNFFSSAMNADFGILKISSAGTLGTYSPTPATYVTSGYSDITNNGAGYDELGYSFDPRGFEVLEDGRLFAVGRSWDFGTGVTSRARAIWSDPGVLTTWTTSPAGATDIEGVTGEISAMGRIGGHYTFHFHSGAIKLGSFTGLATPPLRYTDTRASAAAMSPRVIQQIEGGKAAPPGEIFLAEDLQLHVFDGLSTQVVESGVGDLLQQLVQASDREDFWSRLDGYRGEYILVYNQPVERDTQELRFNYRTGEFYECGLPAFVTASEQPVLGSTARWPDRALVTRLGLPSSLNAVSSNMIYEFREDAYLDNAPDQTDNTGAASSWAEGIFAETDDLELPNQPGVDFVVEEVMLFYRAQATGTVTFYVGISKDGGAFDTVGKSIPITAPGGVAGGPDTRRDDTLFFFQGFKSGRCQSFRLRIGRQKDYDGDYGTNQHVWPYRAVVKCRVVGHRRAG